MRRCRLCRHFDVVDRDPPTGVYIVNKSESIPDGIHTGIPEAVYHALPRLSQSAVKQLLRSPAHYRYGERKETSAMKQGSLIDVALTEPARLDTDYHAVPDALRMDARTKAYQAEQEAAGNRQLVKQRDFDAALRIRNAVRTHPTCAELLDGAEAQMSVLWHEWLEPEINVPCKGRIDWVNERLRCLIDLKSTDDARAFPRKAGDFGYHIQDAAYRAGWASAGGFTPDAFVFIVVERESPHGIRVYELDPSAQVLGLEQWRQGVELYADCVARDHWPAYPSELITVDLPPYYYRKTEE